MDNAKQELIFMYSAEGEIPYKWAAGRYGSRFLTEIRDHGKFWGVRCPSCQKVYIPPRRVCGPCFAEMTEWVELGEEGILTGFSIVDYGFIDPNTGKKRPVPYTTIYVELDGLPLEVAKLLPDISGVRRAHIDEVVTIGPHSGRTTGVTLYRSPERSPAGGVNPLCAGHRAGIDSRDGRHS